MISNISNHIICILKTPYFESIKNGNLKSSSKNQGTSHPIYSLIYSSGYFNKLYGWFLWDFRCPLFSWFS